MVALGKGETDEYKDNLHKVSSTSFWCQARKCRSNYCNEFMFKCIITYDADQQVSTRRSGCTIHK